MKIGFIGLGIMGSRMAANLQRAGYDLIVWTRTREHADNLVAAGAEFGETPAVVGQASDILFTMLSTPEVVEQVAFGDDGFMKTMHRGSIWVDCSTVNPTFSARMAEKAQLFGIRFLDAPVAGTKGPAERAELLILVGGDADTLAACQPFFDRIGKKTIHAGKNGMGSALKMVFNLILGESMLALAEGIRLGESLGLTKDLLFDALTGSAVAAPFYAAKRSNIVHRQYDPAFPLQWLQKDLHLAAQSAYEQGVSLPGVNAVKEVFALAKQCGFAEQDISAIYEFLLADREDRP